MVHGNRGSFNELQAICNGFGIERVRPPKRPQSTISSTLDLLLAHQTPPAGAVIPLETTFSVKHFVKHSQGMSIREPAPMKEPEEEGEPLAKPNNTDPSGVQPEASAEGSSATADSVVARVTHVWAYVSHGFDCRHERSGVDRDK